ncbi:hypothetical protein GCM10027052_25350 [Parafrigoribacterium mesophilum]|uniref:hypothetical protein n=1 Tax=Parafrigoribacterium mesophilum TaxID=433646 RepID=UPI0031FC3347
MAERNRVTPLGDIVATPLRGAWTGNRGRIHSGTAITRFHSGNLWIICALQFRGRWNPQWQPHHYTFLFFHDEAVALAAGHRPCAECRRGSYNAYRTAWAAGLGVDLPSATAMNRQLHSERLIGGTHRRLLHRMPRAELPDGTFVLPEPTDSASAPYLVLGSEIVQWGTEGYSRRQSRPSDGLVEVITPPATVAALRAGYPVQIDPSARPEVTSGRPGTSTG